MHTIAQTGCGAAWDSSQRIARVTEINGVAQGDAVVLRTNTCTPDEAQFILSVAALTGKTAPPFLSRS